MTLSLNHTERTCTQLNNKKVKLLALDIDGTLFDENGRVTQASVEAIRKVAAAGVTVVLATGRDYNGIPWNQLQEVEISYVITTNGSSVYRTKDRKCMYEECIPNEKMTEIFEFLLEKEVYINVFIDGNNYTPKKVFPYVEHLALPEYIIEGIKSGRKPIDDIVEYVKNESPQIQKVTLNFQSREDGTLVNMEEVWEYLKSCPEISVVDGGFNNPEFTKAGVNKGSGLIFLAKYLNIAPEETAAIGDSENDLEIIKTAGLGIAMGNAAEIVKQQADVVTRANNEEGVAYAIEKYV